jgi:hypothetical protein
MKVTIEWSKERVEQISRETFTSKEWERMKEYLIDTLEYHFYDYGKEVIRSYIGGDDDILKSIREEKKWYIKQLGL